MGQDVVDESNTKTILLAPSIDHRPYLSRTRAQAARVYKEGERFCNTYLLLAQKSSLWIGVDIIFGYFCHAWCACMFVHDVTSRPTNPKLRMNLGNKYYFMVKPKIHVAWCNLSGSEKLAAIIPKESEWWKKPGHWHPRVLFRLKTEAFAHMNFQMRDLRYLARCGLAYMH